MRKLAAVALVMCLAVPALAHDMAVGDSVTPMPFGNPLQLEGFIHQDEPEFKGWAYFTVKNMGSMPWTDFHFEIIDAMGYDATSVTIDPLQWATSQTTTDVVIGTNLNGYAKIDFYFPNDPIAVGDMATFYFYTNNSAQLPYFGVSAWPTPEPATLGLLVAGGVAVLLRRRRQ